MIRPMGENPTLERPLIERRRIQWETVFFGLLAAVGLAALLVAMLIGGLVAAGVTDFNQDASSLFHRLVIAGGAIAIAILAVSYLTGGYVAARMARFDGWRQGLGIWMLSVLLVLAAAVAGWIAGGELDPAKSISLPDNPIDSGPLSHSWWSIAAVAAIVPLVFALAGGVLGQRFHRAVDSLAEEDAETEADLDAQLWYGPRRVRQAAAASAASSSEESTPSPAASP
jgi:MFS family permease